VNFGDLLETQLQREAFNLPQVVEAGKEALGQACDCGPLLQELEESVGADEFRYLLYGLVRATLLIDLAAAPRYETTRFEVRWGARLPAGDPRRASLAECAEAMKALLRALVESVADPKRRELWRQFQETRLLPFELPVTYRERLIGGPIHRAANLDWMWGDDRAAKALALRKAVMDPSVAGEEASEAFAAALRSGIKVKTYLTDRVTGGPHPTCRERRWEVHPGSAQFATRAECLEVERVLVQQVCFFLGFPNDLRRALLVAGLLTERPESRCPITLEPLRYETFVAESRGTGHGGGYQIGYLNPPAGHATEAAPAHTVANIAWFSPDGARIQGDRPLGEARSLLREIAERYQATGGWDPAPVDEERR
jgi:hypothetical protein